MSNRYKKKRKVRNHSRDWIAGYYETGRQWNEDNEKRRRNAGENENRGLRNLNSFEKGCIAVIILAIIGFVVKVFVLGHGIMSPGI